MRRFVIASKNNGKLKEIEEILEGLPLKVVSMEQAGIRKDVIESGKTFEENALIKAREVHNICGEVVMADDSGLEVDFLNGAPGIYSSRFAGEHANDIDRNNKLLSILKGIPIGKRGARFVCVIALVFPGGKEFIMRGELKGFIGTEPKGNNGFGYDPLFFIPEYNMTSAQMDPGMKHRISHRGKALKMMVERIKTELGT
ncbi:MAG: XTP/dITP diphosphatase [Clostridium sp.]|nr:XTP/dITP diphosphatase [Clostridium sp.]